MKKIGGNIIGAAAGMGFGTVTHGMLKERRDENKENNDQVHDDKLHLRRSKCLRVSGLAGAAAMEAGKRILYSGCIARL
ncbi:hypothetical protein Ancab_003838 [Ancistrocladus abbreviatus]